MGRAQGRATLAATRTKRAIELQQTALAVVLAAWERDAQLGYSEQRGLTAVPADVAPARPAPGWQWRGGEPPEYIHGPPQWLPGAAIGLVVNWVRFCALCQWQEPQAGNGGAAAAWTSFAEVASRFLQWQWLQFRVRVVSPQGLPPEVWWHDWAQLVQQVHVWWPSQHCGSLVPGPLHVGPPNRAPGDHSDPHPFRRGWALSLRSTPGDLAHNANPLEAMPFWNWPRGRTARTSVHRLTSLWGVTTGAAQQFAPQTPGGAALPETPEGQPPGANAVTRAQMHAWRSLWAAWRRGPFWDGTEGVHPQRGRAVCEECHRVPLLCPCPHGAPPEPWHWLRFAALDHEGAVACRRCRMHQPRGRRGGLWLTACGLGVPTHPDYPGWTRRARPPPDLDTE